MNLKQTQIQTTTKYKFNIIFHKGPIKDKGILSQPNNARRSSVMLDFPFVLFGTRGKGLSSGYRWGEGGGSRTNDNTINYLGYII